MLSQQRTWSDAALIKKQEWERENGGKDIPDVNSKVCPPPVCGQWSFVYLSLLKPLHLRKLHNKAGEFSVKILQSSVKILDVGLTLLLLSNP